MKKLSGVFAIALVASLSFAGIAVAGESDTPSESTMVTPQVIVDEETGTVYVALPVDGELPECGPQDPNDGAISGDATDGENRDTTIYGPGDCIEFVIDHPSGKTHHGAIVSTVAKNLHPSMLNGIKKGEIMRLVAKVSKVGDGDDDGDDAKVKNEKPEKKDKAKKDKAKVKKDKADKGNKDKADKASKRRDRVKSNNGRNNR